METTEMNMGSEADSVDTGPGLERPQQSGSSADAWRENVPDQYRRTAEKFKSPADVIQSYAELERKFGNAVELPRGENGEEQRGALYDRLGRPETPEGYEVTLPEGLSEELALSEDDIQRQDRFLSEAHRIGLSSEQAQAAVDWYYGELQGQLSANQLQGSDDTAELTSQLRKEWGQNYDKNIEYGRRAVSAFGDDETIDQLEGIVGSAQVVRMMARIGQSMGEAGIQNGGAGSVQNKTLQNELDSLVKRDDYWHNEDIQRRVRDINVRLHGTKKVVGTTPDRNL